MVSCQRFKVGYHSMLSLSYTTWFHSVKVGTAPCQGVRVEFKSHWNRVVVKSQVVEMVLG